ncbi:hypothetical protein MSAN_01467300 [Mycena sanguinolenta]|uniref:Uncharacterized protein n=1 Tax=Mycena sanguinolenta TaxID=230812 RepID=A0A8H6YBV4_9AGAR|nr:hypothetical protein MSAN_01467300 [Mycena sanguinolenta]
MPTGFKVNNRSNQIIFCSITNKTRPSANAGEFEIKPDEHKEFPRDGWEDVSIRNKHNTERTALWINRGEPALIHFDGFDKPLTIYNDYQPEPGFTINNLSPRTIMCFISSSTRIGGNSSWAAIPPGHAMTRPRNGWEAVAVKSQDDKQRKGEFIDNKGKLIKVDFLGFDEDFVVHEAPENFIAAEHYAEAIRIADRSYAAGDSSASLPGGLNASIFKCDTLEFLTTGKKGPSLGDHNQIYTLGLLINHLKYGLAEPGLVVSVTPDWVKVAAYTCEFDAIVVLGFPIKAIDLVAPEKKRPAVGSRMLVVSQFTYRGNNPNTQGVQRDITEGPKSLDKWYNFHPLVAQFVSDDSHAPLWKQRMDEIDEELWKDVWELWVDWKARHGEDYFRLGCPTKIQQMATTHVDSSLPGYTAAVAEQ